MNATSTPKYCFETHGARTSHRSRGQAEQELTTFLDRIHLAEAKLDAEQREKLVQFVNLHNLNIDWYDRKVAEKKELKRRWLWVSIALLALIPIFIVIITHLAAANSGVGVFIAATTAVLTSMIGIHKVLSSLLDTTQVITLFWKTSASLKENLYSVEDAWANKAIKGNKVDPGLMTAIEDASKKAREITKTEKAQFFTLSMAPSIDLGSTLAEAGTVAKSLVSAHTSPGVALAEAERQAEVDQQKTLADARAAVAKAKAKVKAIQKNLKDKHNQLQKAAEKEEKDALASRIQQLRQAEASAEDALIQAEADLEGVQV